MIWVSKTRGGVNIAKTGRPSMGDSSKDRGYRIRMSDEELKRLEYCSEILSLSKAEIIRRGIDKMYAESQEKAKK